MTPAGSDELEPLLAEQLAYYRALGLDYEDPTIWGLGGSEVAEALDSFRPTGDVLELACGTGTWAHRLLRHATSVTAVDAAPEMLAVAATRSSQTASNRTAGSSSSTTPTGRLTSSSTARRPRPSAAASTTVPRTGS
jgi:SAM-dependent methyltransferase